MQESNSGRMEFIPLHYADKLRIINPRGRIGIVTLWSKVEFVERKMRDSGIDLDPATSPVAVIGNLYGNGLPHLVRNLLYNPQVRDIVVCGADRSGSRDELTAFFQRGLEQSELLGETVTCIKGCTRVIDDLVKPEMFTEMPRITCVGNPLDDKVAVNLVEFIESYIAPEIADSNRIEVPIPEVCVTRFPSEPGNHNILADSPLEAWRELIFRLVRFGHLVHLRKGDRQELRNTKIVIANPVPDPVEKLTEFGWSIDALRQYQEDMLQAALPADHAYTYGNRIREYFGFDALRKFAERLKKNPQDRDCYLALWDSAGDIDAEDAPCLVSIFFRVFEDKLTMTAAYRTHNALDAWLKNVYGLMKAQEIVATDVGIEPGSLTVLSHSISIDPAKYEDARRIAEARGFSLRTDPNGQFVITIEDGEIVARHISNEGSPLGEYRSNKAERIQHEMARDCAVSDINHAIYIGRQLARAEDCLASSELFVEE